MKVLNVYLPFLYLEKIKRPGKKYFTRVILGDDLFILLLCFCWSKDRPLLYAIGLFFILVSLWCIYELGYIENDLVAKKFEDNPILTPNYLRYKNYVEWWKPWLWSFILSSLGVFLLQSSQYPDLKWLDFFSLNQENLDISISLDRDLGTLTEPYSNMAEKLHILSAIFWSLFAWMFFLLLLRALFWIYNHINKQSRTWVYLILQTCRYFGFSIIAKTSTIGAIFLASHILSRFTPYVVYRYLGGKIDSWPQILPVYFLRTIIYIFLLVVLIYGSPNLSLSLLIDRQAVVIILFCIVRGGSHFRREIAKWRSIRQDGSSKVT